MLNSIEIMRLAQGMAAHAGTRQATIAQNVAQADTPGYKARDVVPFAQSYSENDIAPLRRTRAGHLGFSGPTSQPEIQTISSKGTEAPNGNTVSLETEMVKSAEVRQQHEMALSIYKSSLDILRASIGRR